MDTGLGPGNVFGGDTHLKVMLGMSWGAPGHGSAPPGKCWGLGGTHHGQLGGQTMASLGAKQELLWVGAQNSPCHGEQRCCWPGQPLIGSGGAQPWFPSTPNHLGAWGGHLHCTCTHLVS